MCGIGGVVCPPGHAVDRAALERMLAALRHRGPDDAAIVVEGSVGLVHTRLAIVDPTAAGAQPMAHDGWLLTYNGEVFNHRALRDALGGPFAGGSDTETVLHALARWGDRAPERCNGLFAFAALDVRRGRLLLVRDRFGVKPLYVARHGGALWFASEQRALLAAGVPARADAGALRHVLAHGWANAPRTLLRGVERVAPGTLLDVDVATLVVRERRWYDPAAVVEPRPRRRSRREAAAAVEAALAVAVERRLMSDVPLATMLSGGIDSGLVTVLAAERLPGLRAYCASVADQPDVDEAPFAQRVAEAAGVELTVVRTDAASWRAGLVDAVTAHEGPLVHMSSVPMAQIAAAAHADGVKVLLSGEGADELFGGYAYRWVPERWDVALRRRPHRLALRAAKALRRRRAGGVRLEVPGDEDREVLARARAAHRGRRWPARPLEAGLCADLGVYLPHLLQRQDANTMQHSVETRVPFLDPDLVALALNLPLGQRLEPAPKGVLRDVALRRLPRAVVERPKLGFGFDVDGYLAAGRRAFVLDGLLREVLEVTREEMAGALDVARGQHAMLLWTAEAWARTTLAGDRPQDVTAALWGA